MVKIGDTVKWRNNFVRWHHTKDILNLNYRNIREFWKLKSFEAIVSGGSFSWVEIHTAIPSNDVECIGVAVSVTLYIDPNKLSLSLSLSFTHSCFDI